MSGLNSYNALTSQASKLTTMNIVVADCLLS